MTQRDRFGRKRAGAARRRISNLNPRELWHQGEYLLFFVLTSAIFLLVALFLISLAASGGTYIAPLAGVVLFVWVVSVVDVERLKHVGQALWGSDSAKWLKSLWDSCLPHRDRRGSTSIGTLLVLTLVVTSLVVGTMGVGNAAAGSSPAAADCSTEVVHDAFRDNSTIAEFNDTGEATSTESNTRVIVSESDAFYRIEAENPNGYCVNVTVRISDEMMPATERGDVESMNGTTTAAWHDVTNFDTQETYTEITFTLPANSEATFAPSKPTVIVPSWRDEQKRQAEGIVDRLSSLNPLSGDEELEQREYQFAAPETNGSYVTIPLENESMNRSIDEWRAVYRTSEDGPWRPVNQEADDAVFVRELDGKVQFVFNDRDAEVKFTANPSPVDKFKYDVQSLRSSLADLKNLNIFGQIEPMGQLAALPATGAVLGRDR
ncbi:hypothetical protein G9464_20910 [Halostella sp. JP-L12]|uniref:hypothetical protein n=1 Tax=Halostella TaxID=1843185 RepID=UPI000EF847EE|nr:MULTISPECIES: hypothetical protein [Halostella]NHN50033.1 hypothetical protein [Halostella sp. JP-L12]